jgi:hypothetical protein
MGKYIGFYRSDYIQFPLFANTLGKNLAKTEILLNDILLISYRRNEIILNNKGDDIKQA